MVEISFLTNEGSEFRETSSVAKLFKHWQRIRLQLEMSRKCHSRGARTSTWDGGKMTPSGII